MRQMMIEKHKQVNCKDSILWIGKMLEGRQAKIPKEEDLMTEKLLHFDAFELS